MAISSPGIGSNLPIDDIITKLMVAESAPLTSFAKKEASYQAVLSGYGSLQGALSSFQSAMANLGKASTFQTYKTSVTDATIFSATGTNKALPGSYQINVSQLAQAQTLSSVGQANRTTAIGSGSNTTISFQFGTISGGTLTDGIYSGATFNQDAKQATGTVTIDSSNNSLQGIRDAINAAKVGVTASLISDGSATPDRLVITSNKTGETSSMKITVSGDAAVESLLQYDPVATQGLTQNSAAQNAKLTVNGTPISSASNTVNEAIQGVTLNVSKIGTTTLSIAQDTAAVEGNVSAFVKAYNDLNTTIKNLTAYTAPTKQGELGTGGPLVGDSTVLSIQRQVRKTLTESLTGLSNSTISLPQIGVSFQKDGSLALDSAKLQKAMANNFGSIGELFATMGKTSDSLVNFTSSTGSTKAGSYAVAISKLATQSSMTGTVDLRSSNTTIVANTSLDVKVDGISTKISLTEGSYNATELASMIQSAINGAPSLTTASSSVTANIDDDGFLHLTSNRYGSGSNISVMSDSGTDVADLFGTVNAGIAGEDVVGTIGGVAATGSGQFLSAATGTNAQGLKLEILGGALGNRGVIDFSQGYADRLNKLTDNFIGATGLIPSRKDGINSTIKGISAESDAFSLRLDAIEKRYRAQFTALDVMISSLKSTQEFLTQQLEQISNLSSRS